MPISARDCERFTEFVLHNQEAPEAVDLVVVQVSPFIARVLQTLWGSGKYSPAGSRRSGFSRDIAPRGIGRGRGDNEVSLVNLMRFLRCLSPISEMARYCGARFLLGRMSHRSGRMLGGGHRH